MERDQPRLLSAAARIVGGGLLIGLVGCAASAFDQGTFGLVGPPTAVSPVPRVPVEPPSTHCESLTPPRPARVE